MDKSQGCLLFAVKLAWIAYFMQEISTSSYDVDLPSKHMPYYFANYPQAEESCKQNDDCPYKEFVNKHYCWGYEENCSKDRRYSNPSCNGSSKGWVKSKEEQLNAFYKQGDFGYIRERMNEMSIVCKPNKSDDSLLECAKFVRFCRASNIMLDFETLLSLPEPMKYRDDVIREKQIGGYCKLKKRTLMQEGQHKSPLQSWFAELENFFELESHPMKGKYCDTVIDKPTFIMKLDATVNMYHHFCDFLNLYATLHLNGTFSTDVYILIWDTLPYHSNFSPMWRAFTQHPLLNLGQFKGKKVCFKNAVFPLLPRMIFGMYYNMPLVPGCQGSGLFHAFSHHVRHRLKIKLFPPKDKVRVTLISRSTQYRRIVNEDKLVEAMEANPTFVVKKVNFNRQISFLQQLEISYNTDILIGIHGAGLTHMLFMPEWGAVFEIYNCEDENCYADLARLKGLKYLTWRKADKIFPEDEGHHPTLGAHAKFTNYAFDVEEFMVLVIHAADYVKSHKSYSNNEKNCKGAGCSHNFVHTEL